VASVSAWRSKTSPTFTRLPLTTPVGTRRSVHGPRKRSKPHVYGGSLVPACQPPPAPHRPRQRNRAYLVAQADRL